MYVHGYEIIIITVIFIVLFVAYISTDVELRTLKRDNCIVPAHEWNFWPQDNAHQCRRCGKWEGND